MIESEKIYIDNCFKGLVNNQIFQITSIGQEDNITGDSTIYVTVKNLETGRKSQTNYNTFIRLQLEECNKGE